MSSCEGCGNDATDIRWRGTRKVCIDCVIVEVDKMAARIDSLKTQLQETSFLAEGHFHHMETVEEQLAKANARIAELLEGQAPTPAPEDAAPDIDALAREALAIYLDCDLAPDRPPSSLFRAAIAHVVKRVKERTARVEPGCTCCGPDEHQDTCLLVREHAARERIADLDRELDAAIEQRDRAEEAADELANAVGDVGEHSNLNDPWANALELVTPHTVVDSLRARIADLEQQLARANDSELPKGSEGRCGHANCGLRKSEHRNAVVEGITVWDQCPYNTSHANPMQRFLAAPSADAVGEMLPSGWHHDPDDDALMHVSCASVARIGDEWAYWHVGCEDDPSGYCATRDEAMRAAVGSRGLADHFGKWPGDESEAELLAALKDDDPRDAELAQLRADLEAARYNTAEIEAARALFTSSEMDAAKGYLPDAVVTLRADLDRANAECARLRAAEFQDVGVGEKRPAQVIRELRAEVERLTAQLADRKRVAWEATYNAALTGYINRGFSDSAHEPAKRQANAAHGAVEGRGE